MKPIRVAIVGGGLSGLYAAYELQRRGIEHYTLFEARSMPGGRILSVPAQVHADAARNRDRYDLGPTWYWPSIQRQLDTLLDDLGLARFEQYSNGDMMIERSRHDEPQRFRGYRDATPSMRLAGGMGTLVDALTSRLNPASLRVAEAVRALQLGSAGIEVESEDVTGHLRRSVVDHVLLALPPRLVEANLRFSPALPQTLTRQWRSTPTWMAAHAKYVATYRAPFWRAQGLSGEARSACGPLVEIHDASSSDGGAALFGFFGVPARVRASVADDAMCAHCRAQLARLFGPTAATPEADFIKDWARDPFTATADDLHDTSNHATAGAADAPLGPWEGRLAGIASEWSAQFPGYVAGAIEAAAAGVQALSATSPLPHAEPRS